MIVFDTNAVRLLSPASDKADLIRKLKASGQGVGVPGMVLDELAAQQMIRYRDAYETADKAIRKLHEFIPGPLGAESGPTFIGEEVRSYWIEQYGKLFDIIETTPEMAIAALRREADGLKPAKRARNESKGDTKSGARDVAIWLSIVQYMRDHPKEEVYFVTNNSSDFGSGAEYPSPMDADVSGMEDRLHLLSNWEDVVSRFTSPVDLAGEVPDFLASDSLSQTIAADASARMHNFIAVSTWMPGRSEPWTAPNAPLLLEAWAAPPRAVLASTDHVSAHEIGGAVWNTAETGWLLMGQAFQSGTRILSTVSVRWQVKILFSTSDNPAIVIDDSSTLSLPDYTQDGPDTQARMRIAAEWMTQPAATMYLEQSLAELQSALQSQGDWSSNIRSVLNDWMHRADPPGNLWSATPPPPRFAQPGNPDEQPRFAQPGNPDEQPRFAQPGNPEPPDEA